MAGTAEIADKVPRNLPGSSRRGTGKSHSFSRPFVAFRDELLPDFRTGCFPLNEVLEISASDPDKDPRRAPVEDADWGSVGQHQWCVLIREQPVILINMLPLRSQKQRPLRRYRIPESGK
jgi:hypothetical protein